MRELCAWRVFLCSSFCIKHEEQIGEILIRRTKKGCLRVLSSGLPRSTFVRYKTPFAEPARINEGQGTIENNGSEEQEKEEEEEEEEEDQDNRLHRRAKPHN